jgi:hypothetical protein
MSKVQLFILNKVDVIPQTNDNSSSNARERPKMMVNECS